MVFRVNSLKIYFKRILAWKGSSRIAQEIV